jgi:hydrogenase maturation protein HypF
MTGATSACSVHVRGIVQGVGFRPYVYRLAHEHTLAGWVLNAGDGVEIHLEGSHDDLDTFLGALRAHAPPAAAIATIDVAPADVAGLGDFEIRESRRPGRAVVPISPDLGVCEECLSELFNPNDPRFLYPYINCTNCGPRYSIVRELPYDRAATTMAAWPTDALCASEYHDPANRRFHAQPVCCPACGPRYDLAGAAERLREGRILAVKGIGGYHLACDARNAVAVAALRERKYRKEKPFAVMVRDIGTARSLVELSEEAAALLTSPARPIVLAPAIVGLPGVAPDSDELGIMLLYTPVHHLLFAAGAPAALVMTSGNRSSEPIAYRDDEARERLAGIADGFLVGERSIARRVEDSVVRPGPMFLRRSRGYAPGAVATIPTDRPILALGADLKNTIALVVDGQAFVSQHIGDLDDYQSLCAFHETIDDLLRMYRVDRAGALVVGDAHPEYRSASGVSMRVQHHRAHVASVLAERGEWERRVLGVALDGTGYGDDGTIWGGEIFVGSVARGLKRVAHLRPAALVGGDAAARYPVQAAAGFLHQIDVELDSDRYRDALAVLRSGTRTFTTTSTGRLFDSVAAILGWMRPISFEGQAAIWLEQCARRSGHAGTYDFPFDGTELDFRPLLAAVVRDRERGRDINAIARAFHAGFVRGLRGAIATLCDTHDVDTVVASGGVLQNAIVQRELDAWTNHRVPPNDGGISLGQAALAAFGQCTNCP